MAHCDGDEKMQAGGGAGGAGELDNVSNSSLEGYSGVPRAIAEKVGEGCSDYCQNKSY